MADVVMKGIGGCVIGFACCCGGFKCSCWEVLVMVELVGSDQAASGNTTDGYLEAK